MIRALDILGTCGVTAAAEPQPEALRLSAAVLYQIFGKHSSGVTRHLVFKTTGGPYKTIYLSPCDNDNPEDVFSEIGFDVFGELKHAGPSDEAVDLDYICIRLNTDRSGFSIGRGSSRVFARGAGKRQMFPWSPALDHSHVTAVKYLTQQLRTWCTSSGYIPALVEISKTAVAEAAAEPPRGITPAEALRRYRQANPGRKVLPGFTVEPHPDGVGIYLEAGADTYHARPHYAADDRYVLVTNASRSSVNHGRTLLEIAHVDSVQDLLRKLVTAVRGQLPGNHRAKAAAEPQQSRNLQEILGDHVGNLRVPIPGGDATLTRAMSEIRMNSREWNIITSWFLRIGTYRNMVDIAVCITEHGAVLQVRGVAHRFHAPDLTLPGLTLKRADADADNAVAARVLLAGCRKLLSQLQQRATAAAEPQLARQGTEFSKLWGRFNGQVRKVNADGVPVTIESSDTIPPALDFRMPDGALYSAMEVLRKHTDLQDVLVFAVGQHAHFPIIRGETPAAQMLSRILGLIVQDWKKHTKATAATEPSSPVQRTLALFQALQRQCVPEKHVSYRGVTFNARSRGDQCMWIRLEPIGIATVTGVDYMIVYTPKADLIGVIRHRNFTREAEITTLEMAEQDFKTPANMLREFLRLCGEDFRKNGEKAATASTEAPARIPGLWRGYRMVFENGVDIPTLAGCKGRCLMQLEPNTGKLYSHGPNGFEHHGKTLDDELDGARLVQPTTPVPQGMAGGLRCGYDLWFNDGTKIKTATGIRGTTAVYRDPGTGGVYESGPRGWSVLEGVTTPVST